MASALTGKRLPVLSAAALLAALSSGCGSDPGANLSGPPPAAAEGVERHGLVALEARLRTPERAPRFDAAAYFWQAAAAEDDGCEVVRRVDGCEVSLCLPVAALAQPLPGFAWLSAGSIAVSGTKLAFRLTEAAHGDYESTLPSREMSLWDGGELIRVSVGGSNDFPAVETSVVAPRPVALTAPDLSAEPRVDPRMGAVFEWSSPRLDSVYVEMSERRAAPYPKEREPIARCSFPAERGRGVIPAAVFEAFSAPNTLHGFRFHVMTDSRTELAVGDGAFTFVALAESADFELPVGSPSETRELPASSLDVLASRHVSRAIHSR